MTLKPDDPGYRFALIASCVFFMFCSAGMLVSNKLVLRRVGLPITVCTCATATHALHTHAFISCEAMGSMHARRS